MCLAVDMLYKVKNVASLVGHYYAGSLVVGPVSRYAPLNLGSAIRCFFLLIYG